jgi:dipeptidyl aminopeptidase/acylaminoacyl peptidase
MLRAVAISVAFSALAAAGVAQTHPFLVHDMLAMDRISDPRVSPDGRFVVFTLRATDLEANRGRTDLHLAATDGSWVRRLTTHPAGDSSGRWSADGEAIYFLSSRSGSQQVWRIRPDGGEAEQVTKLPLDVGALGVAPDGKRLVVSMAVSSSAIGIPGGRHAQSPLRLRPREGAAVDLMPQMDADCPTKPFGGSEDYAVSPDGKRPSSSRPATPAARRPGPRTSTSTRSRSTPRRRRARSPRTPPGTPARCSRPTARLAYLR